MRDLGDMEFMREAMYDYLVELRDSGVTNMFGASPFVQCRFSLTKDQALNVLLDWMDSFDKMN